MPWWPGWDSIEGTAFWYIFHFWAGIIFWVLLALAEVVSHYYGERHAELPTLAESRRLKEQSQTDERRQHEVSEARAEAKAANAELSALQSRLSQAGDRDLANEEIEEISAELRPFAGKAVLIGSYRGDGGAARLGDKIANALVAIGINVVSSIGKGDPDAKSGVFLV
jgi:hypothetical protein